MLTVAWLVLWVGPVIAQERPTDPTAPPRPDVTAQQASPDDAGESDASPAENDAQDAEGRVGVVPTKDEGASSDRIRYRDPLDILEEPFGTKWERFLDGLQGITQYSFWDGQLRFRLGLRFQVDGTLVSPSDLLEQDLGPMAEGVDPRRFRLFAEGVLKRMYFRVEFEFATDIGLKTAYFEGREGGLAVWDHFLGKFRYGLFQEPFTLENNMSSFDTSFVEISMPVAAIGPGANLGAMVYDASSTRTFTWAVGVFSVGQDTVDNASRSLLSLSGRFGYKPKARDDSEVVLHFGASVSHRSLAGDAVRYEARPEARFVRPFADTGDIPSNRAMLYGLETAWRYNDTWAQAEWLGAHVDTPTGTERFGGLVLQVGRFLTGMSRPWDDLYGVWGRVRPDEKYTGGNPFKASNGGEWEIAGRYSSIDLTDGMTQGGQVRDITLGVNWYPAETWKLQFNWIRSRVEDSGHANVWVLRYQLSVR